MSKPHAGKSLRFMSARDFLGLPRVDRMEQDESAKVMLEEIKRTRAQLARLLTRQKERSRGTCEECEGLWKAYQEATIKSVQIDEEIKSMTEDQGRQNFSEARARAKASERLREKARQRLAKHQAATGHR